MTKKSVLKFKHIISNLVYRRTNGRSKLYSRCSLVIKKSYKRNLIEAVFASERRKFIIIDELATNQGGRGRWAVYYTSPQSLITMFSYSLA